MLTFFTIVHVLLCVFMIFVILLQPGKDAGMGAALGGGAATSAFGGRGAVTFLSKLTGVCAALFFLTSLGLSFVGLKTSVAAGTAPKPAATAPATPGAAPAGAATDAAAPAGTPAAPASVEQPREAAPAATETAPAGAAPAAPAPAQPAAPQQ
ncbi:preprotein translocase subunit SecG [Hyalangium minutum]|uniref:Protein-export membrane protein SecG n=1 Tax=Hyalangium minutum TaxID=394096 RepID=A0A085WB42_9BACT|nr:preprotein translocase subunit SecG [Hyalangium minutum]KFE64905.1 Preprotein translocase subunit SecG [Hyalangium minutum]